ALDLTTGAAKTTFGLTSSGIQTFGGQNSDQAYGVAATTSRVFVSGSFNSAQAKVGGTGPAVTASSQNAFVLSLDALTGAPDTAFGLSSSGVQTVVAGSAEGFAVTLNGSTLYAAGPFGGNATIGGTGPSVPSFGGSYNTFIAAL